MKWFMDLLCLKLSTFDYTQKQNRIIRVFSWMGFCKSFASDVSQRFVDYSLKNVPRHCPTENNGQSRNNRQFYISPSISATWIWSKINPLIIKICALQYYWSEDNVNFLNLQQVDSSNSDDVEPRNRLRWIILKDLWLAIPNISISFKRVDKVVCLLQTD